MSVAVNVPDKSAQQFEDDVKAARMDAPWFHAGPLIQPKKGRVESGLWKWPVIEDLVRRTPEFVAPGHGADRRILRIANPGVPEMTATHTISIAIQYLLPGEVAPAHRHSPNAMRFMIKGEGAYTTIEGDRCEMRPGDLVMTPAGTWHDHGNHGSEPVIWIDVLDSPVARYLEVLKMEPYGSETQAPGLTGASESRFFAPGLVPAGQDAGKEQRLLHYRWDKAYEALTQLARVQGEPGDPFDDVMLQYVEPRTGKPLLASLGFNLQMIRPGVTTRAHRHSSSVVYFVAQGSGASTVDGVVYEWTKGDVLVIAPSAVHSHKNQTGAPAVLFSVTDVPLLKTLGWYQEQAA